MRKIIQIVSVNETDFTAAYLMALCNDGTVWRYAAGAWSLIEDQIPQHPIDFYKT